MAVAALCVVQEIEELNNQMAEDEEAIDTQHLVSDVENYSHEIEQLQLTLEQATQRYDQARDEERRVEEELADISAKFRAVNDSVEPLKVSRLQNNLTCVMQLCDCRRDDYL